MVKKDYKNVSEASAGDIVSMNTKYFKEGTKGTIQCTNFAYDGEVLGFDILFEDGFIEYCPIEEIDNVFKFTEE